MVHRLFNTLQVVQVLRHTYDIDLQAIGDIVVSLADKGTALKIMRCKKTKIDYKIEVLFNSHNFYPYRLEVTEI